MSDPSPPPVWNLMCKTLKMDYREHVTNHIQGWSEAVNHDYRCKYKQYKEFLLWMKVSCFSTVKLDWQTIWWLEWKI